MGSGNVASVLVRNFAKRSIKVTNIIARNSRRGQLLADECGAVWSEDWNDSVPEDDIVISAVKDSAAAGLWSKCDFGDRLVLHTAGTLDMEVLKPFARNYGVLYPLQTISASRDMDFSGVPLLIEGSSADNLSRIRELAALVSENVREVDSGTRKKLHLAAVFANNFSNLCFRIAWEMLEQQQLEPELLLPLIDETCAKLHAAAPSKAQTGPAVRWDENVMKKHLEMLAEEKELSEIYQIMSREIHRRS